MMFNGANILKLREAKNWSREQLARKLVDTGHFSGFTHQRVAQLERADNASHRALIALCEVFKCSPGAFFDSESQ